MFSCEYCKIFNKSFYCRIPRAFSSSLLRAIIARNHLLFFKIFLNFVYFCRNFQILYIFLSFLNILLPFFCAFSENRAHALTFYNRPLTPPVAAYGGFALSLVKRKFGYKKSFRFMSYYRLC